MAEEVEAYRKSLSTLSSGVVESLSSASITSWQGAGSAAGGSPKMSRHGGISSSPPDTSASIKPSALLAVAKPFSPQGVRELKIQSQLQPHSEILKHLEMEMSQSPQATILRRMKEEARNEEGNSSAKALEDQRIIKLEKEATARSFHPSFLLTQPECLQSLPVYPCPLLLFRHASWPIFWPKRCPSPWPTCCAPSR
jgi:hypothetical protein